MGKALIYGILGVTALFIIGSFPALTTGAVAVIIVFMFLIFGKE